MANNNGSTVPAALASMAGERTPAGPDGHFQKTKSKEPTKQCHNCGKINHKDLLLGLARPYRRRPVVKTYPSEAKTKVKESQIRFIQVHQIMEYHHQVYFQIAFENQGLKPRRCPVGE